MKKRDRALILIELIFTLSFLSILGYMLNIPAGKVVSSEITLDKYPRPFFKSNDYNFIFTTSESINEKEYSCALSILSGMKETETVNLDQDLVPIGDGIANNHLKSSIRSSDLPSLQKSTISIAGDSVSIHDEINIGKISSSSIDTSSPSLESSLTKNKDYQDAIYLNIKPSSLSYHYVFENTVDLSKIDENNPVTISFLGSDLTITKILSDTEFLGFIGQEQLLKLNDQLTIDSNIIKIENIGADSIVVSINSNKEIIKEGSPKTIGSLQIVVKDILFNNENSTVSVIVGNSVADSYKDSQVYGNCNSRCFVWDVNKLLAKSAGDIYTESGPTIGIRNDFDIAGELSLQGCIDFPNNFAKLCFDSLNVDKYSNYHVDKDNIQVSQVFQHLSSADVIKITAGHENGIELKTSEFLQDKSGSKRTSVIYLRPNSSNTVDVLYEDDNNLKWAGTYSASNSKIQIASVNFDKTSGNDIKIDSQGTLSQLDIIFSPSGQAITNDDITIRMKSNLEGINKLLYGSDSRDISSYDLDQRSRYGIIISDIQDSISSNDIELKIPSNQVKASIKLNGQSVARQQVKIPEIIKASQLTDFNQNIIAIGKDNQLYNKLVPEGWQYPTGKAVIKLVKSDQYYILLVAGSTDADLTRACNILANYKANKAKLKGLSVVV